MNNDFYKPSDKGRKDISRTHVPNLYREEAAAMRAEERMNRPEKARTIKLQDRTLVGTLFSISAGIQGELFPVYIGRNTIGSSTECDICLRETSVSALHAILLARKQTNAAGEEYVSVSLMDSNSSYGTTVNGESLDFDRVTCNDGDIITIGQNYQLSLSLFNALGRLTVAYAFDAMPEQPQRPVAPQCRQQPPVPVEHAGPATPVPTFADADEHSTNITQPLPETETAEEASTDFYKPTPQQHATDHYNNKTIII